MLEFKIPQDYAGRFPEYNGMVMDDVTFYPLYVLITGWL